MTVARILVLERMIECLSKRVPRIDVLQSLVHRNYMRSDIIGSFQSSCCHFAKFAIFYVLVRTNHFLSLPVLSLTAAHLQLNLVVWVISLFEIIRQCNDKNDFHELFGSR
jgi:hypothetical protein